MAVTWCRRHGAGAPGPAGAAEFPSPANFLSAVAAVRQTYGPQIHIVAGLSNISFGMPNRKLINMVFIYLCSQAGTDGGIVDPVSMPVAVRSLEEFLQRFGGDRPDHPCFASSTALISAGTSSWTSPTIP